MLLLLLLLRAKAGVVEVERRGGVGEGGVRALSVAHLPGGFCRFSLFREQDRSTAECTRTARALKLDKTNTPAVVAFFFLSLFFFFFRHAPFTKPVSPKLNGT